jgi:plasmid segregation protein ParM
MKQTEHIKHSTMAIDVGYGNTKSAWALGSDITMNMFPSLAPRSEYGSQLLWRGVFKSRNVINVEVDGARYEVGPDVSISGAPRRTLAARCPRTL